MIVMVNHEQHIRHMATTMQRLPTSAHFVELIRAIRQQQQQQSTETMLTDLMGQLQRVQDGLASLLPTQQVPTEVGDMTPPPAPTVSEYQRAGPPLTLQPLQREQASMETDNEHMEQQRQRHWVPTMRKSMCSSKRQHRFMLFQKMKKAKDINNSLMISMKK